MVIVVTLSIVRDFRSLGNLWFLEAVFLRALPSMLLARARIIRRCLRQEHAVDSMSVYHLMGLRPTYHGYRHLIVHILIVAITNHDRKLLLLLHRWEGTHRCVRNALLLSHAYLRIVATAGSVGLESKGCLAVWKHVLNGASCTRRLEFALSCVMRLLLKLLLGLGRRHRSRVGPGPSHEGSVAAA